MNKICLNGVLNPGEICDDGVYDLNGCKNDCSGPYPGWDCSANTSCVPICGDSRKVGNEVCDDGFLDGIGCSDTCNSVVLGYSCIGGNSTSPSNCTTVCGDSLIRGIEKCDDHNILANDGCSPLCLIEPKWNCTIDEPSKCNGICGDGF